MAWIDDDGKIHRTGAPPAPRPAPRMPPRPVHPNPRPRVRRAYCSDRSYVIAGILAVEFGGFGVHNFYIKNNKRGAIQLVISLIAFILLFSNAPAIPAIALIGTWIWGIVEGILIFIGKIDKDGHGADFWRSWFVHLTSAEYVRPYSYPHVKAWVITGIASAVYWLTILAFTFSV